MYGFTQQICCFTQREIQSAPPLAAIFPPGRGRPNDKS
jgi:hypothetical protein